MRWTKIEHRFTVVQVERHGPDGDMAVLMRGRGENRQMGYLEVRMPSAIAAGYRPGDIYTVSWSREDDE